MFGIHPRALQAAWTVFLFAAGVALVYLIGHTLVVFTLAIFLAHLLAPVVELVERYTPRGMSRNMALAAVYLALLGVAAAVVIPVTTQVAQQAAALAGRLPELVQNDPLGRIPLPAWLEAQRPALTESIHERLRELDQAVLPAMEAVGTGILSGLGNVLAAVLIPILSFFFLKDGQLLRGTIVESFAPHRRAVVEDILNDLHVLLVQYIRALVVLAIIVFATHAVFFEIAGVPYAILLATVAGLLEAIPVAGPLVAAAVILLVSGLAGYPNLLWLVVFLIVFRLFQDYVVNPHLMSAGAAIHPLLVLFGVLAGEQVAGIPGMFFSVPVMAALRIVVLRLRKRGEVSLETHA